ncbi:LysR family transcriptional regulator [Sphingomonas sp. Leaf10]|uniref:LysR family transcriptional regulator n=1 Tax=Sphingomonas sp. Leaf10 TaxID=1735676 RepID=UPI0006F644BC|nr:LysR family transcriptional regulator [Sphingomonas sp. Leaf10]KQM40771.1 LysR family transcriptional regulator [Sphingomonas sp. Leaf10]
MRLPDFEAWAMFACVVEHRSFSAAAQSIGVSKATVSKAVARLEASLGTTLFHRTSRRLTLSDAGQSLAERAGRILAEAQAAEEQARDAAAAPTGLVRVAAPMSFGQTHVAPAIAEFLKANPGVEIDLTLSDAKVDIVADGIDIALRIAELPDSSLRARRLGPVAVRIVAAPGYWQDHGRPTHPADLGRHACFRYTNLPNPLWHFRRGEEEVTVRPGGPLAVNNGEAMLPALRLGLGVARLPDFLVDADIDAGLLEPVLPDWSNGAVALHLLTPPGTLRPARVAVLIDFLSNRFRSACPRG